MTRKEFFEWLITCPSHKWEINDDEYDYVVVGFPTDKDEEVNKES